VQLMRKQGQASVRHVAHRLRKKKEGHGTGRVRDGKDELFDEAADIVVSSGQA